MPSTKSTASLALIALPVLVTGAACGPGDVRVVDAFAVDAGEGDVVHDYAPGARVPLSIHPGTFTGDVDGLEVGLSSGEVANVERDDDDVLRFDAVMPAAAAEVVMTIDAGDGVALPSRTLLVRAPDRLTVEVTAPAIDGIDLPAVDASAVRIVAGESAGFRTSMFAGDDELMGLDCVELTPADPGASTRAGIGCARSGCDASRLASVIEVPATATGPFDVTLAVATATLTLTVVPTAISDITALTAAAGGDDVDGSVFAAALAGDAPVFGAPIAWTGNGVDLVDDNGDVVVGDVVRFDPQGSTDHALVATIGDRSASIAITGDDLSVTSITAACATTPGGALPLLLAGLAGRRWRRRRG